MIEFADLFEGLLELVVVAQPAAHFLDLFAAMVRTHSGCPPPPAQIVQPRLWRTVRSNSEPRRISPVTGSRLTSAWRIAMS
jgi:hypothetical protein